MVERMNSSDADSLELWRQRLAAFRISRSQLTYASDGKVVASGGFGNVRKAIFLRSTDLQTSPSLHPPAPIPVAVKALQVHANVDIGRFERRFIREAYIWSQLKHENVLEFLGFYFSHSEGEVDALLVCPWYEHGQSISFIKRHSLPTVDRLRLILDAAEGLHYLHSRQPPICHGDIKGANFLINDEGRGALCDFGSAHELDEMFQEIVSKSSQRCTIRWTSPERLDVDGPPTQFSDVWSWGWLAWEIMTEKVPFDLVNNLSAVIYHIITFKLPHCDSEPSLTAFPVVSRLIRSCWAREPSTRPGITVCIRELKSILVSLSDKPRGPYPLSNGLGPGEPLRNVTIPHRPDSSAVDSAQDLVQIPVRSLEIAATMNKDILKADSPKKEIVRPNDAPLTSEGSVDAFAEPTRTTSPLERPVQNRFIIHRYATSFLQLIKKARVKKSRHKSHLAAASSGTAPTSPQATRKAVPSPSEQSDNRHKAAKPVNPMPQSDLPLLQLPEDKSNQGVTMQEEAAPEVVSHYRFSLEGSRKVSESPTQSPARNHLHPLPFHTQLPEGPKSSESSAKGILRVKREGEGSPDVLVDRIAQRVNRVLGLSVYGESDEDADRNDEKAVESNAMSGTFEANPSATPEVWPRSSVAILSADVASFESLPKSLDGQDLGSGVSTCRPIRMVTRPPSPEDERLSRAGQNYARPRQNQSGLEANRSHCRKSSTSSDAPTNAHRRGSLGDEKDNRPARNRFGPSFQLQQGYEGFTRVISSAESMKSNTRKIIIVHEDGKAPTHYQLGNCIGKGQIGSVYRALDINTGRIVAVKRISLAGLPESEIIQLTKEVHLMKRLSHPSIVQYEGIVRNDDSLDIVLEYVENGSVGQALKAFGKFEERLVARYATKILEGLHYLHEQQVVHCNLRGANILSTRNGNIKLSDFGLSLTLSAINNETGIPNWMAPEVIELKGALAASDIWSLGCTIVELLTGGPPYSELGTSLSVMFRIVEDDTAPIPDCCSEPLRDFLSQCFRKDPTERPTAESLFEHPWLKQMWGSHKELRPSDSIPFLRRLSNDVQGLQRSTQILAEVFQTQNTSVASPLIPSPGEPELMLKPHSFVEITANKPVNCRVCLLPVKGTVVICKECSLICHATCAKDASGYCDIRAQLLFRSRSAGPSPGEAVNFKRSVTAANGEESHLKQSPPRRRGAWPEPTSSSSETARTFRETGIQFLDYLPGQTADTTRQGIIRTSQQLVAIKSLPSIISDAKEDNIEIRHDFRRWHRRMLRLQNPRIPPSLGAVFLGGEVPAILTPWYSSGNIADFLKSHPGVERKPLLRQVAEGLAYLHNLPLPIIHSNLKPGNILVDDAGTVKLGDVGVLDFLETRSPSHQLQGKPDNARWTAPEALEGRARDRSSDVYSLGCVALLILNDQLPYEDESSDVGVMKAIARGAMPIQESRLSTFYPIWSDCWARDISLRPRIERVQLSIVCW